MSLTKKQQKFDQLTRPWRDRLYSVAMRRSNMNSQAEDWLQETFLRAWRDFDRLLDTVAIYAWLLKILERVIADDSRRSLRRQQLAPMVSTDEVLDYEKCTSLGPFEQTLQQQSEQQLLAQIRALPEDFAQVILLRDIEGLSYQDIAKICQCPQGTIMSRLSRGRRLLASAILKSENISDKTLEQSNINSLYNRGEK